MSIQSRQKKHFDFILALEEKLARYLFNLPEQKILTAGTIPTPQTSKMIVEVVELKNFPGWWGVSVNGVSKEVFYGSDAQKQASKKAADIANGIC